MAKKKIQPYLIVNEETIEELEQAVAEKMARGWIPIAGFFVKARILTDRDGCEEEFRHYYQPMMLTVEAQNNLL